MMDDESLLLYGRVRRRDLDDGHDDNDNGDLLADFGQLEDETELPEFRGGSQSVKGGSPSSAVAGVDLSSFYTSHEGDDEEKDGTVRLEGQRFPVSSASWQSQSVVPSTPSYKLQFEHQVVSEKLAQTDDSTRLPQRQSKTHSSSPCQTLAAQRIVHDAPTEDSRALYNSSLRWHGTEVSEEEAEKAIKMSPNVVLHPDQLHDHETRSALLRRKIRKEALYAFRMSDSSKTGLLDRDDFDHFMATMGYTAPVQQLVSKSDLLLSEKSFVLASQLSKIHVKSTEPLLSDKLKHGSMPKGFESLDAFADIKQASTQSAYFARGSDGGSTINSKSVSPNYIHVDADFTMSVFASGVTLEGAVGFAQVIFGLDEFDSHELRLISCEIRKRQLMHKRRKVVPIFDGKEETRPDEMRSLFSRTELLKSSSRQLPVNQERRHMFRKERYEELKSELQNDFEAKHPFRPTVRALEVIHVGSRVDALIHRNLGGDVIDGRGEWISALVRSSFSDDTYEVELLDVQPPASLMRLPKERIRASSSSSAASSVSSLDDLTRRSARERSSSVRRQDVRKTEERELEEVCTFQPSVKPAPSRAADAAAAANKPASRRRRQVPPPPPQPGSTTGATTSVVGFTSGGGGGLFVPGQGFLPGAPTSVGMALFYYNPSAPPSFSSGTYKVIQYTSVAEGMPMVYSSPAPSSSSSLSSSSSSTSARALIATTSTADRPLANNFPANAAGPQAPGGDGIPIAPVLPAWVWTTATSSSGAADIMQTPGKSVSTPSSKVVIKKKIPGEAKDEKASGSGWQNVLEELARKVGGGKGNDSLLKKVEVRQVGKLSTGKKGRRGAKDFSDVIDELSYTLAKMRGEIKDDEDGDGNGDDEPGTPLANGSPASVGKTVLGKISSVLKPPPPPPPPQKPTGPALKLARPKALMIPQPPLLDESKFPYKQKADVGGVGPLSTSASTTPLAKLFPCLPSVVLKEAVPTPSVKPAPPPLPSTWPPQAYVERAALGGGGARGAVDLVGGGAVRGSGLHDVEKEHRGGGGGGAGVAVMAELPIVGPMSGGFSAIAAAAQNVTFHDNPLPAGYYAAAPDSIAVSPGSIVPAGTTLSEHLSSTGAPLVASLAVPSEDSSVNNTADGNSEASSAGPHSPHLPSNYFAAIQRMRRAHEVRRAREEIKHFGDARYFDETKLHERPQRTQPEEFHFAAAERAEQKKVFTHRQKTPERERPTEDWARSGAKFVQGLRDYSPNSRTPRADSPSRSKSHDTQRSHSRGSIIFAGLARDFPSPSPSKRSGGVSLQITNPSLTQPVEPKLHSPFVALKNREIRLRRQQERDFESAQVAKQLKDKKEAVRLLSMSTYSPLTPRRHAHERILEKNPELLQSLAKLCL